MIEPTKVSTHPKNCVCNGCREVFEIELFGAIERAIVPMDDTNNNSNIIRCNKILRPTITPTHKVD